MDHQIEKMGIVQIMSTKKEKKDDGRRAHFGIFLCVSLFDFHIRPHPETTTTTTTATLLLIQ